MLFKVGNAQDFLITAMQNKLRDVAAAGPERFAAQFPRIANVVAWLRGSQFLQGLNQGNIKQRGQQLCATLATDEGFLETCFSRPSLMSHLELERFPKEDLQRPPAALELPGKGRRANRIRSEAMKAELARLLEGDGRLVVDHGTGNGNNLLTLSKKYPNHRFIGTERMATYEALLELGEFSECLQQLGANAAFHVFGTDVVAPSLPQTAANVHLIPFDSIVQWGLTAGIQKTFPKNVMKTGSYQQKQKFLDALSQHLHGVTNGQMLEVIGEGQADLVMNLYPNGDLDHEDQLSPIKDRVALACQWLRSAGSAFFLMEDPICFAAILEHLVYFPGISEFTFSETPLRRSDIENLGIKPYSVTWFDVARQLPVPSHVSTADTFGTFNWGFPVIIKKS